MANNIHLLFTEIYKHMHTTKYKETVWVIAKILLNY